MPNFESFARHGPSTIEGNLRTFRKEQERTTNVVLFVGLWIIGIALIHLNHAAIANRTAAETILLVHWLHEFGEHVMRLIELAHSAHTMLVG